jgi:serine protease AprX
MGVVFGVSWDDKKDRIRDAILAALITLTLLAPALHTPVHESVGKVVSVIVRELPGSGAAPEQATRALGGEVGRHIGIINGFVAELPEGRLWRLRATPGVQAVTLNQRLQLQHAVDGYDPGADTGSVFVSRVIVKAGGSWEVGLTGQGVDIALVDSGVAPVNGLTYPGKVINGPDLSFEANDPNLRYIDTYGHGTHLAGIMAGKDDAVVTCCDRANHDDFMGIAPNARIVSIKVANARGSTDVSQVLAAIDWVVQHRNDNGMNIRVLNLSFGTDGIQDYTIDPLTFAAEVAWRHGIVVVVAAGNTGFGSAKLNNPAYDPFVIAVGADDNVGTYDTADDVVPGWSARGDATRHPDLVAPGKSIASLRAPGSTLDNQYPSARVGSRFFRGSGTSQSAAVVSGAAALLIQQRPELTPDQVKALLIQGATPMPLADTVAQGAGVLNIRESRTRATPIAVQTFTPATGIGSLEAARGSGHVGIDENQLTGEQDIFGTAYNGVSWSTASLAGVSWSGGSWNGNEWSGVSWSGVSWSGVSWSGVSWSGVSWSGVSWSSVSWSGVSWSGVSWSGAAWSSAAYPSSADPMDDSLGKAQVWDH